jgi:preprotein translocase subunit SecF
MRKGTLARIEINISVAAVAALLVVAGYSLGSAVADRVDPKVRACVEHEVRTTAGGGHPVTRGYAAALCKHLEEIGAL